MWCFRLPAFRWRRSLLVTIAVLAAGPAGAQLPEDAAQPAAQDPAPGSVITVTWADVVRLVDQHPRVAAGRLGIDAALGAVDAAGAAPNPSLEASVGEGREVVGDGSDQEWGLALDVPLGWIVRRESKTAAARAEVDVARAESLALRREVLLELRTLFWTVAYEQARVASLSALEQQTAALVRTVSKRVEVGEVRPVDGPRAEIELEMVASELDAARTTLGSRQAQLARWLGAPAGATVTAAADLTELPLAIDLGSALERVQADHPALEVARARVRSLEAAVASERIARAPDFSLLAFGSHELDRDAYGIGVSVELPLWSWNAGRIAEAEAELAAGRLGAEADARELEAAVIEVEGACRAAAQTAARFGGAVIPRSQAATATLERAYELGETSLLELIDARRTLIDTDRLHLGALAQAQIECGRLASLLGEEGS